MKRNIIRLKKMNNKSKKNIKIMYSKNHLLRTINKNSDLIMVITK
jgi:hypothetical protein